MVRRLSHRHFAVESLSGREKMLPRARVQSKHAGETQERIDETKTSINEKNTNAAIAAPGHVNTSTNETNTRRNSPTYMLYAHIPFCEQLCSYCSFNRFPFDEQRARAYFAALRIEMQTLAELGYDFKSLYIGGGTPTVLMDELCAFIDEAQTRFSLETISCETNPNHLAPAQLGQLEGRVQRLSVGVQSFDDEMLRQMGRLEKCGSGKETLSRLQKLQSTYSFATVNADMIFNFPGQTKEKLKRDLACILESGVNQISFYPLMVSPSTTSSLASTVGKVSYKREQELYELICEVLVGSGNKSEPLCKNPSPAFKLGSAWSFNRVEQTHHFAVTPTLTDEYIVDCEEYPALGAGSFSYLDGALYLNTFSVSEYIERFNGGSVLGAARAISKIEFSLRDRMRYRFMMQLLGLRLDKRQWECDFGCTVAAGLPLEYAFYKTIGAFATDTPEELTLSFKGRYLIVALMRQFFIGINDLRDAARAALPPAERAQLLSSVFPPAERAQLLSSVFPPAERAQLAARSLQRGNKV
ncbi:MAG: coproporphyrinogen III oxidase family protein [Coriobacteriia bacterium]|nr:coproporphyrinogen III oxidase family protein [Coriobacteriia bacterium]